LFVYKLEKKKIRPKIFVKKDKDKWVLWRFITAKFL